MAKIFDLLRLTVKTDTETKKYFFLGKKATYAGITEAECGVTEASGTEVDEIPVSTQALLGSPYISHLVFYIRKGDGKRTAKTLIVPTLFIPKLAKKYPGKVVNTGTVISVMVPRRAKFY